MFALREFLQVVRSRWLIITVVTVLGAAIAGVATAYIGVRYAATARLLITAPGSTLVNYGSAYEHLIDSRALAQLTIEHLGLNMDAEQLAKHVHTSTTPDSPVVDVTAEGSSPQEAALITNALTEQFVNLTASVQPPIEGGEQGVRVRVAIIDRARDGELVGFRPGPIVLIFGGLLGLFTGLVIAFVWERLDDRIRLADTVKRTSGDPPLAEFPSDSVESLTASDPRTIEAFRRLRVNLTASAGDKPPRVTVVTGASMFRSRSVGRIEPSLAIGLAVSLARDGKSTLLIAIDPRVDFSGFLNQPRPEHSITGTMPMFSELETGLDQPRHSHIDNLYVAGRITDDGPLGALTDRDSVIELLKQLQANFDYTIIAVPCLGDSAVGAVIASVADGVVVVGTYGKTRRREVVDSLGYLQRLGGRALGTAFAGRERRWHLSKKVDSQPSQRVPTHRSASIRA